MQELEFESRALQREKQEAVSEVRSSLREEKQEEILRVKEEMDQVNHALLHLYSLFFLVLKSYFKASAKAKADVLKGTLSVEENYQDSTLNRCFLSLSCIRVSFQEDFLFLYIPVLKFYFAEI